MKLNKFLSKQLFSGLNKPQLNWLAKLLTDLGKGTFLIGVIGFFIPSADIKISPVQFLLSLLFSLTMFILSARILKEASKK